MKKIDPKEMAGNVFSMLDDDSMLITGGNRDKFNTMTASWGGFGVLWNKNVCTIYVRPTRYTHSFLEKERLFSCTFFPPGHEKALNYCGSKSGRDVDKVKETGLTPVFDESGAVYFAEGRLVIIGRTLYSDSFKQELVKEPAVTALYPQKDYHTFYIGEIITLYVT